MRGGGGGGMRGADLREVVEEHAALEVLEHKHPLMRRLIDLEAADDVLVLQLTEVRAFPLQDRNVLLLQAWLVQVHHFQGVVLVGLLVPAEDDLQERGAVTVSSWQDPTGGGPGRKGPRGCWRQGWGRTSANAPRPSVFKMA